MEIKQINTKRNLWYPSGYQIVCEWEDIFARELNVPLYYENSIVYNKFVKRIGNLSGLLQTSVPSFMFNMWPIYGRHVCNRKNIIPCIVDCYFSPSQIPLLSKYFKNNPLVLFSNMEAIELLDQYGVSDINYKHLALSLPDNLRITKNTRFKKTIDLIITGRKDMVFQKYIEIYKEKHPDFYYAYSDRFTTNYDLISSEGENLGKMDTRDKYLSFIKKSKIALYTTPVNSLNRHDPEFKGFHQVTPRFLEYLASGCHVISRFDDNSDTRWYRLEDIVNSIDTYDQFEEAMDNGRNNSVNMEKYSDYLSNHYTSKRVEQLKNYLKEL
jgi:hypothetical protein